MQPRILGDASDCGLGQVAQRKQYTPQCIPPHRSKEVRLILFSVHSTQQLHSTCDQASLPLSNRVLQSSTAAAHRLCTCPGREGVLRHVFSTGAWLTGGRRDKSTAHWFAQAHYKAVEPPTTVQGVEAGVVAGRHTVRSQGLCRAQQSVELDVPVACQVRIRSQALPHCTPQIE